MTEPSRYEAALRRILHTLAPYGDDLVVIGGWVPYLYQRYGGFRTCGSGDRPLWAPGAGARNRVRNARDRSPNEPCR